MATACSGPEVFATTTSTITTTSAMPPTTSTSTTTTSTSTTTTTFASVTTTTVPTFQGSVNEVTAERLAHSWTPDCPVAPEEVVLVEVSHWGFDGAVHAGAIVVASAEGENVLAIFRRLFDLGYPIESVIPIGDLPPGIEDDDPDYNNTSALHCRRATGSTRWSEHAKGLAIDINPLLNPFITSNILWPAGSERYLDRSLGEPGMIGDGDQVVQAFADHGWLWGGYWSSIKDYQHFSVSGR